VSGGGTVVYQAGQSITLMPGFTAIAGSGGTAFIAQMVAPTFTVTSSAAPTLGIGQSVSFPVTITPEFGFAGTVTPSVPSLPTGFGVAFSPTSVSFSNSNPATVTVTLTLGSTATVGSHSLTIQGGSLAGQMVSVPVTVTALPAPVISLASPANGADIWGQVDLSGYALVNTPGIPSDKISGVAVSIAPNDGSGAPPVTGAAIYGATANPRPDICGTGGLYPGGTNCPYVQFDYLWSTGLAADGATFTTNGSYTATLTASDSSSPQHLTNTAAGTFTVDNQPPVAVMVSPINNSGAAGVSNWFIVDLVSPHPTLDIGYGQIWFDGPQSCTVQWDGSGSVSLLNAGSSPCTLVASSSSVVQRGANALEARVAIIFPQTMIGTVSVQGFGTDAQGNAGPMTPLTFYTVTGAQTPALLTSAETPLILVPVNSYSTTATQSVALINGATGPAHLGQTTVSAGSATSTSGSACPGLPSVTATLAMDGTGTVATVSAQASSPSQNANAAGCSYIMSAPVTAGSLGTTLTFFVLLNPPITQTAQLLFIAPSGGMALAVPQGQAATFPISVQSMYFTGSATLTGNPPAAIGLAFDNGGTLTFSASGTQSLNATVSVPATTAPGVYPIDITTASGEANTTTVFVTVQADSHASPDFTMSSPVSESIQAGTQQSFSIQVARLEYFSGQITLSSPGIPDQPGLPGSAIGLTFNPAVVGTSGGLTQVVTVTILSTAVTSNGTYTIPIVGTSGSLVHSTSVTVTVHGGTGPGFTLSTSASVAVHPPSLTTNLTLQPIDGFSGVVNLSATGSPSGLGVSFTNVSTGQPLTQVTLSGADAVVVAMTISPPSGVTNGTYTLTVTASGGGIVQTQAVAVTVSPTPSISMSFPTFQSLMIGQWTTFLVTVTTQNYSGGPVTISAAALPLGVAMAPVTVLAGAGTVAVTFSASSSATPNKYSFYLNASGGGISASPQSVILTIPNFVIAPTLVQQVTPGSSATVTSNVTGVGGYAGAVSLVYSNGGGFTVTGPGSVMPGGTLNASVTASQGVVAGSYPILTATDNAGLSVTIPVGAFAVSNGDPSACGGAIFNMYFNQLSSDPYATGLIGTSLSAKVTPGPSPSGWTSTISNATLSYLNVTQQTLESGYYFTTANWETLASNAGPAASSLDQAVSLSVPASGGVPYQGPWNYDTQATFTYNNPNCTIHLSPWDFIGVVSAGGHTVTYVQQWDWFGYDITPIITSLNPSTVYPGPAAVTIIGVGFGDHPTVVIGPSAAPVATINAGSPVVDGNGYQELTVTFAVPDGYVGSALPVVVQSNGEGGNAFFQYYLSKPQSAAALLQVAAAPTISIDNLQVTEPATPNAASGAAPAVSPVISVNTVSGFAAANSTDLLTVLKNSGTLTVTATNVQPQADTNQVRWQLDRDPTDTVDTGIPMLSGVAGGQVTLQPSTAGNFRLIAYVDRDGSGSFDEGEQLGVLRFAVVQATLLPGSIFRVRNTLAAQGLSSVVTTIANAPMALYAPYLLEGGGADRTVGTAAITIGDVGNLLGDTFAIAYPIPDPVPPAPGNVFGTGSESPGGPTPMVDTLNGAAGSGPMGGATAFRSNSQPAPANGLPPVPQTGGAVVGIISGDAPKYNWRNLHPTTYNLWGTTNGSNLFREFLVAFSSAFPETYVSLNRADWSVGPAGTNNFGWEDAGSSISGDSALQPVGAATVQVLGFSFGWQNQILYQTQ